MTKRIQSINDCFLHDKNRLRYEEALEILQNRLKPVCNKEQIELTQSNGRILAESIVAKHDIPISNNAAVDGYGFRYQDLQSSDGSIPVTAKIVAGGTPAPPLEQGSAVRIFTGAVVPDGVDTIAMQEDCELIEHLNVKVVSIPKKLKQGSNLRMAGEDMLKGGLITKQGLRLRPQEIAAIASTGLAQVVVHQKLKIATVSTGNEIVQPGGKLKAGQVFNSNTHLIASLLQHLPVDHTDLGTTVDDRNLVVNLLKDASREFDVILTTGGASLGEEDHLNSAIEQLGTRYMWQLAIKPGRPMCVGQINDCTILALPGNPVAVMVCYLLFGFPIILRLAGSNWFNPTRYPVTSAFEMAAKKPGRREFLRGKLQLQDSGNLTVDKFERDGSGLITGLREADGLIELEEDVTKLRRGDTVSFIPFNEYGICSKV